MKKPIIFISGPFRGRPNLEWNRQQNIRLAESAALAVWRLGGVAICPHKNTEHFDGACPDEVFLEGDLQILERCDAVFLVGEWITSVGATYELGIAKKLNLAILYTPEEVSIYIKMQTGGETNGFPRPIDS